MTGTPASIALTRRSLLGSTAVGLLIASGAVHAELLSGALPFAPDSARPPIRVEPGPWQFFTSVEAASVEAIVDRLIPEDTSSPGGKAAGCGVFIDRQLAGPYGRGDGLYLKPPFMPGASTQGYQNADAPAARYRAGLKGLADYCREAFAGRTFDRLSPDEQDVTLKALEAGTLAAGPPNASQFFALLLQNTQEGFFADPVYGGNRDMAGWKMIGFPGTRYDYRDWVERHNERYPLPPVGIQGRLEWTDKG
jgi:gluconate 2-dehydrogenase gamma chain